MTLCLLLPPRRRFAGQPTPEDLARALGRADADGSGSAGTRAQLQRHVRLRPSGWPVAALTRALDRDDADTACWLRADPVHVRADMTAVRLVAWGQLGLSMDEAQALLGPLKPLCGDLGFPIDAGAPERWYLRLPREAWLPGFVDPDDVLGTEIHDHLPAGDAGRRWRQLLNEAQIVLHNHPLNAARIERGLMPVNSLWFWGGGVLPDAVTLDAQHVHTREITLGGLASAAGRTPASVPARWSDAMGADALVDLRHCDDLQSLARDWLMPALQAVFRTGGGALVLDFADGHRLRFERRQRWRLWRRPAALLP